MRAKLASKYLGIGTATLWRWAKAKKINPYKISNGVTIFKKAELDALINSSMEVK